MSMGLIMSVLFAAQSVTGVADTPSAVESTDAAYEEMASGETEAAIARLEATLEANPGDPSLLINLGTAYFRANRIEEARASFRRAIASDERYSVELADGTWEDSRKVARVALDSLERSSALAAK